MGTQVITTDTGRRLGVVGEVVVDIDRREVVALGLRDNPLTRFAKMDAFRKYKASWRCHIS
jgi:sporulation protein YlmC with PRC-barrel domain